MQDQNDDIAALLYRLAVYGDEGTYRQLFDLFYPSLKKFASYFLKSREQAEEVASDVLFAVWENRAGLMDIENIRVWLYVIARNKCLNLLKQQASRTALSIDSLDIEISCAREDPEQICINTEIRKKVEAAIGALPGRCKLIFKLVKEEGMSYKEVAAILAISPKTVDAQLVIALRKIAQAIRFEYTI